MYVARSHRGKGVGQVLLARLKEQGLLDGRWVDTIVMEKLL